MLPETCSNDQCAVERADLRRQAREAESWRDDINDLCQADLVRARAERDDARAVATRLATERDQLRLTNNRLNRRVQAMEGGIAEKIKNSGGSIGRSLANAGYRMIEGSLKTEIKRAETAEAKVRELEAKCQERHSCGDKASSDGCGKCLSCELSAAENAQDTAERQLAETRQALRDTIDQARDHEQPNKLREQLAIAERVLAQPAPAAEVWAAGERVNATARAVADACRPDRLPGVIVQKIANETINALAREYDKALANLEAAVQAAGKAGGK